MTIPELRQLLDSGKFHHATYRNFGNLWEGLWIYEKADELRGFLPVGTFAKEKNGESVDGDNHELKEGEETKIPNED